MVALRIPAVVARGQSPEGDRGRHRIRRQRGSSRWLVALVGAITVAGLLLRLPSFGDSLFGDELSTYFIVTGSSLGRIGYLLQGHSVDLNPPLFFWLGWLAERFGHAASALRMVSLLAGTATIPLTYLLGVRTVGRRAALVATALVALAPFLIFYSSEARGYALTVFLVLACTLAVLRALDTRRVGWWVAYGFCSCAAVYTHYITVFFLATLFGWAFWTQPEARRSLLVTNCAAAIAYLPWLPTLLSDTRSPGSRIIGLLEPFTPGLVKSALGRWSIGHPFIPLGSLPGRTAIALVLTGLSMGIAGLALNLLRIRRDRGLPRLSHRTVLMLLLAIAPPIEIGLYSTIGNTVWEARNLIAGLPALALLVGALLTSARGLVRAVAVGLVIGGFAVGAAKMLDSRYRRPDYDAAVSFIDRVGSPGDPVLDLPGVTPGPLTELDAAFAVAGHPSRERHPVLRLGYPSLDALLRAQPYGPASPAPLDAVTRRAQALARGGTLFMVGPQGVSGLFLHSIPARFRVVQVCTFSGLYAVTVTLFHASAVNGPESQRRPISPAGASQDRSSGRLADSGC